MNAASMAANNIVMLLYTVCTYGHHKIQYYYYSSYVLACLSFI